MANTMQTAGRFLIDGLTGSLLGGLIGIVTGLLLGMACGVLFIVVPFAAVVGIMIVAYGLIVGLASGVVAGCVAALAGNGRVRGGNPATLAMAGLGTGAIVGAPILLVAKTYGWQDAADAPFAVLGSVLGGICGGCTAFIVAALNRPRTVAPGART